MSLITLEITRIDPEAGANFQVNDDVARCWGFGQTPADALKEWADDFVGFYETLIENEHRLGPDLERDLGRMKAVLDL